MNTLFTYNFDDDLIKKIKDFELKNQRIYIDQNYEWHRLNDGQISCLAYIEDSTNKIIAYSFIREYYHRLAIIDFGPVSDNKENCVFLLEKIISEYKKKNFFLIQIKLPFESSSFSDFIRYSIKHSFKYYTCLDHFNWSTIHIDLSQDIQIIEKNIASRHKQSIKKAINAGLEVREIINATDLKKLIELHQFNYDSRNLKVRTDYFDKVFFKSNEFILQKNQGFALGVFEKDKMIGGVIFVSEREYTRYYIGASDTSSSLPILHLAIFKAIQKAKLLDIKVLDLGGYNHVTNEKQVHNVNLFKRGFGGDYIFYPEVMYIPLKPFAYPLFKIARYLKFKFNIYV